jgi:hypothetical protein
MNNLVEWHKKPFGSTPVQAFGWINKKPFYFWSRYKTSEIELSDLENVDHKTMINEDNNKKIYTLKEYKTPYEAGYIEYHEAERLIKKFAESLESI